MKRASLIIFFFLLIFFLIVGQSQPAKAIETGIALRIDQKTISRGYTVATADGNLKIALWPKSINQEVGLVLKPKILADVSLPATKQIASDFYEFEIKGNGLAINKPFTIQLKYNSTSTASKAIYFYNYSTKIWSRVEPALDFENEGFIRAELRIPYALFAVLEEKISLGQASWYGHRGCDCAASPDYSFGSWLKVTNLANSQSVMVVVNDYGPDRAVHPERIIDLDVVAFKKIADKSLGVIDVKVEKIK